MLPAKHSKHLVRKFEMINICYLNINLHLQTVQRSCWGTDRLDPGIHRATTRARHVP